MLATGAISRVKLKRLFCPARSSRSLGSSLQRNDAAVWLFECPGLSFQRSLVCACSLVSSLLLSGATMSQQSSLTNQLVLSVMHLQIVEVNRQLTRRYVASTPHSWAMLINAVGWAEPAKRPEC